MTFQGFSEKTLEYFIRIRLDNSRAAFESLRADYNAHVKTPLLALHEALVPVISAIDPNLRLRPARCVSGAYNDARFSRTEPIKTYMYLHYRAGTDRGTDIPGFFMDASADDYRYGLQLYHPTTAGMALLRDAVLSDSRRFTGIVRDIERRGLFTLEGDMYKKDRYPDAPPALKDWLNRKRWWLGRTHVPDGLFFSPDLTAALAEGFQSLSPLYRFISEAVIKI